MAEFQTEHDDVIKWKHFSCYWTFVRGIHRSSVNSPHKGQWRGALICSLICAWIKCWVNNREAGDMRRHRAYYDVIVMSYALLSLDLLANNHVTKLDESTARRHLKSPRPLSGKSLHLTSVIKWSRSHLTLKIQMSRHDQCQNHWSHLRLGVQSIRLFWFRGNRTTFGRDIANSIFDLENSRSRSWPRSNRRVTFEASTSINMFAFRFVAIGPFWLRYSEFHIWPWKFKVKVTTKIDQNFIR